MITNTPQVTFKTRIRDESIGGDNPFKWQNLSSQEIFENKKIVLFALPGAFTPTCSSTHLPGYETQYQEFINLGIDEIYCLSVNDAFVMFRWKQSLEIKKVKFLPDGNYDFTKAMDMLVDKSNLGFGLRSWRYSMYVENTEIKKIFSETGKEDNCATDPFAVSDADTMLNYLKTL